MKIGNVLRFLFSVGATILVLSMNWMATPSPLSTKSLGTKLNGIRLVAPTCGNSPFCLFVVAPPCQAPPATMLVGGLGHFEVSVIGPDGRSVPVLPSDGSDPKIKATFVGALTGEYRVRGRDVNGVSEEISGGVIPCSSLTQTEWGKNKPKFNGKKRGKTLKRLFASSFYPLGRDLTVGVRGARSVTFFEDATFCFIERLPASGPPVSLPAGLGDAEINAALCQSFPQLPLVGGEFQNELLGQTIALTLNAGGVFDEGGLTPDGVAAFEGQATQAGFNDVVGLWRLVLCSSMVTQAALPGVDGVLGTRDDLVDPGLDGVIATQDDPQVSVTIPTSVLNSIATGSSLELLGKFSVPGSPEGPVKVPAGSVGRLLMLANFALAGETNLGGANLIDINSALDAVNRAFDGCRFLIGCSGLGRSNLQVSFSPNPVPQDTRCGGPFPSWVIGATLNETGGVGVTINRFTTDLYNSNGDLISSNPLSGTGFASLFTNCGPRSNYIAANGRACALICQAVVALPSRTGSLMMRLEGTDDNGQPVSITSGRLVLLGSGASAN